MTKPSAEALKDLARRVDCNVPDRRDPERFFVEKSEVAHELKKMAKTMERKDEK